jgi:hypothetical protein
MCQVRKLDVPSLGGVCCVRIVSQHFGFLRCPRSDASFFRKLRECNQIMAPASSRGLELKYLVHLVTSICFLEYIFLSLINKRATCPPQLRHVAWQFCCRSSLLRETWTTHAESGLLFELLSVLTLWISALGLMHENSAFISVNVPLTGQPTTTSSNLGLHQPGLSRTSADAQSTRANHQRNQTQR